MDNYLKQNIIYKNVPKATYDNSLVWASTVFKNKLSQSLFIYFFFN